MSGGSTCDFSRLGRLGSFQEFWNRRGVRLALRFHALTIRPRSPLLGVGDPPQAGHDRRDGSHVTELAPGLHFRTEAEVDSLAYDHYTGRWSRLFVPDAIAAASVRQGEKVLDMSTGTGEAAIGLLPVIGSSGTLIGADISPEMTRAARQRVGDKRFLPITADGQELPFQSGCFDAVICQLGLQFYPNPARGLGEFRRVLRPKASRPSVSSRNRTARQFGGSSRLLGATSGVAIVALTPVMSGLMGIPVLGEWPAATDWAAISLISIGVYVVSGGPLPRRITTVPSIS